jgi:hypothetical protein
MTDTTRTEAPDDEALARVLELIDERVKARADAVMAELKASDEIMRLVAEARRKGAIMPDLARRVKRVDRGDRKLKSISRQALDLALAQHEGRRSARTTRASRRRREPAAAGGSLNLDALK